MLNSFNGMQIFVSGSALETTNERLFPASRHRSKRIRKKLIKKHGGEFRTVPAIFRMRDRLIMHPAQYAKLRAHLGEAA